MKAYRKGAKETNPKEVIEGEIDVNFGQPLNLVAYIDTPHSLSTRCLGNPLFRGVLKRKEEFDNAASRGTRNCQRNLAALVT